MKTMKYTMRFVSGVIIVACALVVGPRAIAQAPATQPTAPAKKAQDATNAIYDEQADAREQIKAAITQARKENRHVLIQWGANWCGWCHLLHGTFSSDSAVRRKLLYEYDFVLIDIGRWDKNMDLALEYGADLKSNGVPYLTVLAADGSVIANQETGSLEAELDGKNGHDAAKVLAFLEEHQAPYLPADSILAAGLAQAKKQKKRIFLHFGAPWCGWCHRLEDWMATRQVKAILGKDFIDVKIDIDRTIGGKEMLARYRRSERGGIPWFAFLGASGDVLANSNGSDGKNIGFPYTDEEIAKFRDILATAATQITEQDLDKLGASLVKQRQGK